MADTEGKIEIGISHIVYALDKPDGSVGETWKPMAGAVQLQVEPQGSTNNFYADNSAYYTSYGASSDNFTLEIARLTDEAKIDLLGHVRDSVNGGLGEPANAKPKMFTMGFQYEGDTDVVRGLKYGCTLSRPSSTHNTTTESSDPDTITLDGSAIGKTFTVDGEEVKYINYAFKSSDENDDGFKYFYTKPITPGMEIPQS